MTQPNDGIAPLLSAIKSAKKSLDILIFRLDWKELEAALKTASSQGVAVRALIAHTNRGGESKLRNLEMRFLEAGITVGRTADDLIRYHGKMMIVDRRTLYLLSFNFVHMDIDHSRGFGIVTKNAKVVQEAVKLFPAEGGSIINISPVVSTFRGQTLYWVAFSSRRPYGTEVNTAGLSNSLPQLWFAALTLSEINAGDPSWSPVWLPGQNPNQTSPYGNHTPQWVKVATVIDVP